MTEGLKFTFGDFISEPETSGLEDTQTYASPIDDSVVKVVESTEASAIQVPKKVSAPKRVVPSNDLANLFKKCDISPKGSAPVLKELKDSTTSETIDASLVETRVEKSVEISQPCSDLTPPPVKRRSKHKARAYLLADSVYLEVKAYFHDFVKNLSDSNRVPLKNAFKEIEMDPLKHPMVFKDNEVREYFLDCVYGFFRDAKKNHGHRPNFIELDFTYVPANKQSIRSKLLLHKKGRCL